MDYEEFFKEYPHKPRGAGARPQRWRTQEVDVVYKRAKGHTWQEIADSTGLKLKTVERYTAKEWWDEVYVWFVSAIQRAKSDEERAAEAAARKAWQTEDAKLKALGIKLGMNALIETMQGKRPRDEVVYRQLLSENIPKEVADYKARMNGKMPSPSDRVWAAKELFKATGYTTANEEIAKLAIEQERKARAVTGGATGIDLNIGIQGVEFDDPGESSQ